jgi:hypothetical protein
MARYVYETANGKQVKLNDYLFSEMGIEGLIDTDQPGKYILALFLGDGSILYDYESGKTPQDFKNSREQYKAMIEGQNKAMAERAEQLCLDAQRGDQTVQVIVDEDGEPDEEIPYRSPNGPEPGGYA